MPYDPLSPDRKPQCYRTLGPDHYDPDGDGAWNTVCDGCLGSDCSAWKPQVRVTFRPHSSKRARTVTMFYNTGTVYLGKIDSMVPTGLGVCAENDDAPPWRDPQAPVEAPDA